MLKLQKHNQEYKEFFDSQNERMNLLRNVNKNLEKKLQAKAEETIMFTQQPNIESSNIYSDQRVAELEVALHNCSG